MSSIPRRHRDLVRFSAAILVLTLLTAPGVLASSQTSGPAPSRGRDAASESDTGLTTRESIQLANALDQFALVQARRALQLDEQQYGRFVPLLRALQQVKRRNFVTRTKLIQDLRRTTGPRAAELDDASLRAKVEALRAHDERAAAEIRAATDAIDRVLTPRQQARFRVFEENIEARKLELLMNARARAR